MFAFYWLQFFLFFALNYILTKNSRFCYVTKIIQRIFNKECIKLFRYVKKIIQQRISRFRYAFYLQGMCIHFFSDMISIHKVIFSRKFSDHLTKGNIGLGCCKGLYIGGSFYPYIQVEGLFAHITRTVGFEIDVPDRQCGRI